MDAGPDLTKMIDDMLARRRSLTMFVVRDGRFYRRLVDKFSLFREECAEPKSMNLVKSRGSLYETRGTMTYKRVSSLLLIILPRFTKKYLRYHGVFTISILTVKVASSSCS